MDEYKLFERVDLVSAWELGKQRSYSMGHADTKNSGNFLKGKPAWWRHFIGALGEYAYSKETGEPVDIKTIGRGDDGTDFAGGVQVKAANTDRPPNLLIGVKQYDRKCKNARVFVLIWVFGDKRNGWYYKIMGKITKERFEQEREIVNYGYGDVYKIDNKKLEICERGFYG